ncbi:MAG: calcium-translocating P-type ATPase, PMCA-type, partial [Clostridia bacterium]|nr:calcium-translocating P-type ATPase, PMCA-type [Clostridia bacterium]
MKVYTSKVDKVFEYFNSTEKGLSLKQVIKNREKFGKNVVSKQKGKSFLKRLIEAFLDPMLIILEIATVITLGVNIGKSLKGLETDFYECAGIIIAILISVVLTLVMEGKSQKAFNMLNSMYKNSMVKVIRDGETTLINQSEVVAGDVILLESGDKIICDARLISSNGLKVDESSLTGESTPVKKDGDVVLHSSTLLADRKNMVFSGTFVVEGSAKCIATAVGDNAEIGAIASELQVKNCVSAPLQEKLNRLGKLITALGSIASVLVLILTISKIYSENRVSFDTLQDAFINSIILIVASVPEGLPTTVAIALTLNVVKLSHSNALIKKLVATETVGCVSVICSDKTGTLTENKMSVQKLVSKNNKLNENLINNIAINSTANLTTINKQTAFVGNVTEGALLTYLKKNKISYAKIRESFAPLSVEPFSSNSKFMTTEIDLNGEKVVYLKGAIEVVLNKCNISLKEKREVLNSASEYENNGMRIISFAHKKGENDYIFDGFAVISDSIRKDVYSSVKECQRAGISVKMLTGDSLKTAYNIAKQLDLVKSQDGVLESSEIENLTDEKLKKILPKISVVARSTPKTKVRIVKLLKEMGEVVACTGDGINDAPAIKHADIGIAMGDGSEITKEASDIILLDNSFSTIVKAISFGRNIYSNFQRFITFQLSVNLTAVTFIIVSIVIGLGNPFNTLQLLWINIIMDGPPALTLGLENHKGDLMSFKPVKRSDNIVSKNMLLRILFHAVFTTTILALQYKTNFIGCQESQKETVLFSMFILFQLFNAFNCRELGKTSVFKNIRDNKLMLIVFAITFIAQIILTQYLGAFLKTTPLSLDVWLKCILTCFSIIAVSELYKLIYRKIKEKNNLKN